MADAALVDAVVDARRRTLELLKDLSDEQLMGPRLPIVNPLRWEVGHVGWFQEHWVLRHALERTPSRADGDALYDSSAVPHDTRWELPLPSRAETLAYLDGIQARVREALAGGALEGEREYFVRLAVAHEDMHAEAFTYTRQTLGYTAPPPGAPGGRPPDAGPLSGDAHVPGGRFRLGAEPGTLPFLHDNEKWAHEVEVRPFAIARAAVSQGDFAAFVSAGGYRTRRFWSDEGWRWREAAGAAHPVYWRPAGRGFERRDYDRWVPLEPHRAVIHVNAFEAEAYCRFAGRRLPTELEWEVAAAGEPDGRGGLAPHKRRYPWGDTPPTPERANLDARALGCADVGALPAGDSAFGCRQMIGNVWEWTASDFLPYPGFSADPYRDYSLPWFGTHRVLRGGCWVTRARLIRNVWRNFYTPDRRDVLAGFRTCAR